MHLSLLQPQYKREASATADKQAFAYTREASTTADKQAFAFTREASATGDKQAFSEASSPPAKRTEASRKVTEQRKVKMSEPKEERDFQDVDVAEEDSLDMHRKTHSKEGITVSLAREYV